jgi:hypothetical protein
MYDKYIVDFDSRQKIHVNFPSWRVEYYLLRTGAKDLDSLAFDERKKVFLLSIKDFLDGTISLDEMSGLALKLWRYPVDMKTPEESELNEAIYAASELSFYVRKIDSRETVSQFDIFMFEVLTYFKQYFHDHSI